MPPDEARAAAAGAQVPASIRTGSSRPMPRLLLVVAAALLVARIATGVYERRHPAESTERIHWRDPVAAEAEARLTGRPILFDFTADWCGPCQLMRAEVFADLRRARELERRFVPVQVRDLQREQGKNPAAVDSLQRRFSVRGFPTLVVYSPATGRHESVVGYRGPDETVRDLTAAAGRVRSGSR